MGLVETIPPFPQFADSFPAISLSNDASTITSELTAGLVLPVGARWILGVFYTIHLSYSSQLQNSIEVDIEDQIDGGGWNPVLNVETISQFVPSSAIGSERFSPSGFIWGLPTDGDGLLHEFRIAFRSNTNINFVASTGPPLRPHTFNLVMIPHR